MKLDFLSSSPPELSVEQSEDLTSVTPLHQPSQLITNSLSEQPLKKQSSKAIFGSTFLTIFLAEFGDKTQVSTLLMSAESQAPWVVFLGSATALIITSLLGVLLGYWLATKLAPQTIEKAAGISLLFVSLMLLWDVFQF